MTTPPHDLYLDLRGLACPLPVLKLRKALLNAPSRYRILVEATDPLAAIDIPHHIEQAGHRLILSETEPGLFRCVVEKVGGTAPTGR
ncbi:sulfurtransferase TusA family protein [Bauldia sp.]|uniref:sulfurtransferase TusA family protein n=1 Tax=Bauldia sp. TaxID=2575872 RepID=UPI003BAD87F8